MREFGGEDAEEDTEGKKTEFSNCEVASCVMVVLFIGDDSSEDNDLSK